MKINFCIALIIFLIGACKKETNAGEKTAYLIQDSLKFSIFDSSNIVFIKNEGNVPLNYSITTANNFISTSSLFGSVLVGQQNKVVFKVDRTNLANGKNYSQIYLNINNKLHTIGVSIENFKEQKMKLTTDVIDAEYSKVNNMLVYVSSTPSKINIYNTSLGTISSIDLNYVPTCVSVSADGTSAVVGHDGHLTYVNLNTKTVIKSFSVSCETYDIVLGNNNWAYVFPKVGRSENIRCVRVDLMNDNEVLNTGNTVYVGTKARLHPSGKYIYVAENGVSPADIEKFDIQNGIANHLYDSPYHGDYEMGGDLWFSEDGLRVFTRGQTVFKTTELREQDMTYNGKITLTTNYSRIMWLDHSATKNNLYIISTIHNVWTPENNPNIFVHNASNLSYKSKHDLEKFMVANNRGGGNLCDAEPHYVFSNSLGDNIFVLAKAKSLDSLNLWAIEKIAIQ